MSDDRHSNPVSPMDPPTGKGYALSGKIMLSAIVVLFAVVVIMVLLHIYARWYLLRHRSQHRRRRRGSRRPVHHLVFYVDPTNFNSVIDPSPASAAANRRLDPAVLKSLPTFTFSTLKSPTDLPTDEDGAEKDEDDAVLPECAVCLSEFEDGERGRLLPRCGHSFHVDCIDMWFHSHSTCPLCRSPVAVDDPLSPSKIDGDDSPHSRVEIVVNLSDSDTNNTTTHTPPLTTTLPDSNHRPDSTPATPLVIGGSSSSSSFGGTRKGTTDISSNGRFSIEIPARSSSFSFSTSVDELSPASQAYRSPTSRLLSLRRILSREKKPLSSSPATSPCSSSYNIIGSTGVDLGDIEEGRPFETPKTPR